jgi:hypothetical protein
VPISWITAFKVIPWADVIEATPAIVRGAKQLWSKVQRNEPPPASGGEIDTVGTPEQRLAALEARVQQLGDEARASSELIDQLAQHNARLVEAVQTLRVRTRVLMVVVVVLGAVLAAALLGPGLR